MNAGKIIVFEGVEGAGKTTQLARAADFLRLRGRDVVTAREPGGTAAGELVRDLLLERDDAALAARTELLLYLAARAELVEETVRPAVTAGKLVLLDRFVHSTLAYQGYGLGVHLGGDAELDLVRLHDLNLVATGGLWPDIVILLDLPVEEGLARRRSDSPAPDRIEARDLAFHRRVRDGFLALAAAEAALFHVVDAARLADDVFGDVARILDTL